MTRQPLPNRRRTIRQKARIAGQTFYLDLGIFPDGTLGEIFLVAAKAGSFSRGVLDGLARMASTALRDGAAWPDVVKAIRALDFTPQGPVQGSDYVELCTSVADWVAQEIEAFCSGRTTDNLGPPRAAPGAEHAGSGDESVSVLPSRLKVPPSCTAGTSEVKLNTQEDLVFALGVSDGNVSPSLEKVAGFASAGSGA